MNKIVRENYPASRLPDDLRGAVPLDATVRVTVEDAASAKRPLPDIIKDVEAARKAGAWPTISTADAVARIRALRDEWDD